MTTEKQTEANRENALLSTGAKTEEGKAAVSKNAVKHGIFTKELIIEHGDGKEDCKAYEELLQNMMDYFNPQGQLETALVEKIAVDFWRLKRVIRFETGSIRKQLDYAVEEFFKKTDIDDNPVHKNSRILAREMEDAKAEAAQNALFLKALKSGKVDLTKPTSHIEGVGEWDLEEDYWAVLEDIADEIEEKGHEAPLFDEEQWPFDRCRKLLLDCGYTDEEIQGYLTQHFESENKILNLQIEEKRAEIEKNIYRAEVQKRVKILPTEDIADKILRYERSIEKSIFQKIIMLKNLQGTRFA